MTITAKITMLTTKVVKKPEREFEVELGSSYIGISKKRGSMSRLLMD